MTRNHNLTNRRGVWYIRQRVSGRDVWRSLKTGDAKEARRLRDQGGKLTAQQKSGGVGMSDKHQGKDRCPHCGATLTESEARSIMAAVNGRKSRRTITDSQQAKLQEGRK